MPIDGGNHWNRHIGEGPIHAFKQLMLFEPLLFGHAFAFFQIAARAKYFIACTRENNATNISSIFCESSPEIKKIMTHLRVERIAHLRTIQSDFEKMRLDHFSEQGFVGGKAHRSGVSIF